ASNWSPDSKGELRPASGPNSGTFNGHSAIPQETEASGGAVRPLESPSKGGQGNGNRKPPPQPNHLHPPPQLHQTGTDHPAPPAFSGFKNTMERKNLLTSIGARSQNVHFFVASCLLAVVSWYTTLQGMSLYLSTWLSLLAS